MFVGKCSDSDSKINSGRRRGPQAPSARQRTLPAASLRFQPCLTATIGFTRQVNSADYLFNILGNRIVWTPLVAYICSRLGDALLNRAMLLAAPTTTAGVKLQTCESFPSEMSASPICWWRRPLVENRTAACEPVLITFSVCLAK